MEILFIGCQYFLDITNIYPLLFPLHPSLFLVSFAPSSLALILCAFSVFMTHVVLSLFLIVYVLDPGITVYVSHPCLKREFSLTGWIVRLDSWLRAPLFYVISYWTNISNNIKRKYYCLNFNASSIIIIIYDSNCYTSIISIKSLSLSLYIINISFTNR